jgi:hypothetical protein
MTALGIALGYIKRGWAPVPVPFKQKGPVIKDWQALRLTRHTAPRYFNGDPLNIGVILGPPSADLCDVDLDCPEAIAAAALLPPTARFGRSSTPGAHWLYRVKFPAGTKAVVPYDDPVKQRSDAKAARLVELRIGSGKGAQTVFPGSTHACGEPIRWENGCEKLPPAELESARMTRLIGHVAAGALLIRYWPPQGNRHDLSLALGGCLARAGWKPQELEAFVATVVQAAGDPRPTDRVRCARDAAEAASNGEPAYGFPKLKEILGDAVAARLVEWLGLAVGSNGAYGNNPVIRLDAELTSAAEAAERAIIGAGLPLFRRDTTLVHPLHLEARGADDKPVQTVGLAPVTVVQMRSYMEQAARFERYDARTKAWSRTKPPTDVAELILGRAGHWPFPAVRGVLGAPSLRPDGSILDKPGYDTATGMYLIGALALPDMPQHPTHADAETALTLLEKLLAEFPLDDDDAKAVALSALLSPVVRAALPTVPLHAISAPEKGSGKSYLCDLAAAIATGFCCPVVATGRDEEELEKRLVAAVLDAQPILSLDNISRPLGGDFLCQLLDRPLLKVRVLGQSAGPRIEPRLIVLATGNNLTLTGDIIRRAVIAHMDAETEEPWQRQFADNPLSRIMTDRDRYVAAALTICRAFMLADDRPEKPLPSFVAWSNIVRSALLWLGCGDPVRTMAAASEDDPERQAFGAVLAAWTDAFSENSVTVAEVVKAACERDSTGSLVNEALHDALAAVALARSGSIDNRRLGHWLRRNKDRRLGRMMLRRQGQARFNAAQWQVKAT